MLLATGGFLLQDIHSWPLSCMKWFIFWWFILVKALGSFPESTSKVLWIWDLRSLTFPLYSINLCKHMIKESVLTKFAASVWMTLLDRQVNIVPCCFISSLFSKKSTKKGQHYSSWNVALHTLAFGKDTILYPWCLKFITSCLRMNQIILLK